MRKNLMKVFILVALTLSLLCGCGKQEISKQAELEQRIEDLEEAVSVLKTENDTLKGKVDELEQAKPTDTEQVKNGNEGQVALYTADVDTLETKVVKEVNLKTEMSLEEKLQEIGNQLSKECFNGLPIEVREIKEIDNKKVAIVNLKEAASSDAGWSTNYFTGSAGGAVTTKTLIESFLQKKTNDEWIDGVKFLYEGQDIVFDHVPELLDTIYK